MDIDAAGWLDPSGHPADRCKCADGDGAMFKPTDQMLWVRDAVRNGIAAGSQAILCQGPPGCGKTAFSSWLAQELKAVYFYHLLHSWSDDQELFAGIDVAAAVTGDGERVRQAGVLALAAEASVKAPVVVCLDEIDKAPERTEYLLLDFLQTGRVPIRPGVHIQARRENLVCVLTSNDARPLSDPLLRRCRRFMMNPLPPTTVAQIISERLGVSLDLTKQIVRLAAPEVSLQEITNAVADCLAAPSFAAAVFVASQWLRRDGSQIAKKNFAPAWGEIMKHRRAAHG